MSEWEQVYTDNSECVGGVQVVTRVGGASVAARQWTMASGRHICLCGL
jgi:hypothetical protein